MDETRTGTTEKRPPREWPIEQLLAAEVPRDAFQADPAQVVRDVAEKSEEIAAVLVRVREHMDTIEAPDGDESDDRETKRPRTEGG